MPINKLPLTSQPRKKLFDNGPGALSDIELLAIIINSGVKNKDAIDIAKDLLLEYSNLNQISNISLLDLQKQFGIGKIKSIKLTAIFEFSRRINETNQKIRISDINSICDNFLKKIVSFDKENFYVSIFSKGGKHLFSQIVNVGTADSVNVDPSEIIALVLKHGGRKFYCFHNHPSEDIRPSKADELVTQRIKNYCELFGIKMLGHLIINSKGDYFFIE